MELRGIEPNAGKGTIGLSDIMELRGIEPLTS
jgi:hypothetical protein